MTEAPANDAANEAAHDTPHISSPATLIGTFLALIALTGLTVGASELHFGGTTEVVVALSIATAKALIVALVFMHLWHDAKFNLLVLLCGVLGVVLFVSITFIDVSSYQPEVEQADPEAKFGLPAAQPNGAPAAAPSAAPSPAP